MAQQQRIVHSVETASDHLPIREVLENVSRDVGVHQRRHIELFAIAASLHFFVNSLSLYWDGKKLLTLQDKRIRNRERERSN